MCTGACHCDKRLAPKSVSGYPLKCQRLAIDTVGPALPGTGTKTGDRLAACFFRRDDGERERYGSSLNALMTVDTLHLAAAATDALVGCWPADSRSAHVSRIRR